MIVGSDEELILIKNEKNIQYFLARWRYLVSQRKWLITLFPSCRHNLQLRCISSSNICNKLYDATRKENYLWCLTDVLFAFSIVHLLHHWLPSIFNFFVYQNLKNWFSLQETYLRGVHLHSDFEMSSSKNLVGGPGFFVYFELDFCRLHRQ